MSVREQNAKTQEAMRGKAAERARRCEYCGHTPGCYCRCPSGGGVRYGHKRAPENREEAQL